MKGLQEGELFQRHSGVGYGNRSRCKVPNGFRGQIRLRPLERSWVVLVSYAGRHYFSNHKGEENGT